MKDIPGFKGLYAASKQGEIWSYPKYHRNIGAYLSPGSDKDGYLIVGLYKNKKQMMAKVHRLIALTYIPNPLRLPQVNHKNGVKYDNRVENLEWVTGTDNQRHARKTGLMPHSQNQKLTEDQVKQVFSLKGTGSQTEIAKKYNVSQTLVSAIHRRVIWKELLRG